MRNGKHAKSLRRKAFVVSEEILREVTDGRCCSGAVNGARGARNQYVRSTFDKSTDNVDTFVGDDLVERGHEFVGTVKRNLCNAWTIFAKFGNMQAALHRQDGHCTFCWVADKFPFIFSSKSNNGVVAKSHGVERSNQGDGVIALCCINFSFR